MLSNLSPDLILRFSYSHFQTEGKFINTCDALNQVDADRVLLCCTDGALDEPVLSRSEIVQRLARAKVVIAKLRRQGIVAQLILPGFKLGRSDNTAHKNYLKFLCVQALNTGAQTIWIDHSDLAINRLFNRRNLLASCRLIFRSIQGHNRRIRLGLIGALSQHYENQSVTAHELAEILSGGSGGLLAQPQPFTQDYNRADILRAAHAVAVTTVSVRNNMEIIGSIDCPYNSPFHRSTEATRMQINLNMLYGIKQVFLNCFDMLGTAPGAENLYLQMQNNIRPFMRKLAQKLPEKPQHKGICVILPGKSRQSPHKEFVSNPWPEILWRLGMPVRFVRADDFTAQQSDNAYVLTGAAARTLTNRQLKDVFHQGVLLDANAAQVVHDVGLDELMGLEVGGSLKNIQSEVLSDQGFAASYYGQRIALAPDLKPDDYRSLNPVHPDARPITMLAHRKTQAFSHGIVIFDDKKHNRRSAVLPYCFDRADPACMLTVARQLHLHNLFCWLGRGRLPCFVENTPDLAPFYIPYPQRRRIIVALLNMGFDWAIDARIRLAKPTFKINRVRELNEQGQIVESSDLKLTIAQDYNYIQLTSDTAVPPMQMTILLLEG